MNRSSRTAQCGPYVYRPHYPRFGEALGSAQLGSWQHFLGNRTPSRLPLGIEASHVFGPQDSREHWRSEGPQCARAAVARVSHPVRLHTGVSQRHFQRKKTIFCTVCQSLPQTTTAVHVAVSPSCKMGVFSLIRACGLRACSSPVPGVDMGELVPRLDSAVLGGLLLASSDFGDLCAHRPREVIDVFSAPSGRLVARVSAVVTTVDRCRPTPILLRFLPFPLRAARTLQTPPLPRRLSPKMLFPR